MSFRLFIYYSAVGGAWAALVGWFLGRLPTAPDVLMRAGIKGLALGASLAGLLSLVDALWNLSSRQAGRIVPRVVVAMLLGGAAGYLSGILTQWAQPLGGTAVQVAGWGLAGVLIGLSLGGYDLLMQLLGGEATGAFRKMRNCLLGGLAGGLAGGVLLVVLTRTLFAETEDPWFPGALGFVVLGACIGLLIGWSQVLLKEAWFRVESGFRAGRELVICKGSLVIGRAEQCDIGLFGDPRVEKRHACISRQNNRYLLSDNGTESGTWLNDRRIETPTPLRSGDRIRIGRNVLQFGERDRPVS
jgi:hypothetical protein